MEKDDLLNLLESRAEEWINTNQTKSIVGTPKTGAPQAQKIDFYPRQISYIHKEITEIELIAEKHGGLITHPDNSTTKDYKLRVQARVGDLSNTDYCGVGQHTIEEDIPYKNKKAIESKIDEITDSTLKNAFQKYWANHATMIEIDEDKFKKLSEEDPVEYMGKERQLNLNIHKIGEYLEEASSYLSEIKDIETCETRATIQKVNKRFVNIERKLNGEIIKSKIFTSDIYAYLFFEVEVRDKNKQITVYQNVLADYNINKVLNDDSVKRTYKSLYDKVKERENCEIQESGEYCAIFDEEALGFLIHEGSGAAHLLSAKEVEEEHATTFKNKIGKKIMPKFISIYNDPTKEGIWGSYKYDEEGVKSQRIGLVKDGILMDYLHDRSTAGRANRKSNGCCRVSEKINDENNEEDSISNFIKDFVEPRVGILEVVTSNPQPFEKMIKKLIRICKRRGMEYGLLIEGGKKGEIQTETGEFIIYPNMISRIYTDGKIVPVSSAYITGNPYNILNNIIDLGDRVKNVGAGYCGADSGFVTTSEIAPYALISKIEVKQDESDRIKKKLEPEKVIHICA